MFSVQTFMMYINCVSDAFTFICNGHVDYAIVIILQYGFMQDNKRFPPIFNQVFYTEINK